MDAVEFLKEINRMCGEMGSCNDCPLDCGGCCEISELVRLGLTRVVETVEKWSKEHPRKTMAQDFFEKYPNAPRTEDDMPFPCPDGLGYCKHDSFCIGHTCMECWSRPMED